MKADSASRLPRRGQPGPRSGPAPWVVPLPEVHGPGTETWLLGPGLTTLRVGQRIPDARALRDAGWSSFVLDTDPAANDAAGPPVDGVPVGPVGPVGPVELTLIPMSESIGDRAAVLATELRAFGMIVDVRRADLNVRYEIAGALLFLADREPIDDPHSSIRGAVGRVPVVWAGETVDGTHVGPVIRSARDMERYQLATSVWSDDSALRASGMQERPLPLLTGSRSRARRVALALRSVLRGWAEIVLVDPGRPVNLWTDILDFPVEPGRLLTTQSWAKGLLKQVSRLDAAGSTQIYSCLSPTVPTSATLEANSGRGPHRRAARGSLLGEVVERTSALRANARSAAEPGPIYMDIERFHPFGQPYRAHRDARRGPEAMEWYSAVSLTTGRAVDVPACLVAFPYVPRDGIERPSQGGTSGLAAYPDQAGAVLRGLREVLERDTFYPRFLAAKPGRRLRLPSSLARERGATYVIYTDRPVPIVHCFLLFDTDSGPAAARGTGSGLSWSEAATAARSECAQIATQVARAGGERDSTADPFATWRRRDVVEELTGYLETMPEAVADPLMESPTPAGQIERILNHERAAGREVLLAELPCVVRGWHAVRVLIPGAVVCPVRSDSDGGRRLPAPAWRHGIPA